MPGYGDPPANRKKFSSEYQPKNRGRKKSILKQYTKDHGISKEDVRRSFEYVLGCSRERLQEILKDPKQPAIIVAAASALLGDIKKNTLKNIDQVLKKANIDSESSKKDEQDPAGTEGENQQFHTYSFPEPDEVE